MGEWHCDGCGECCKYMVVPIPPFLTPEQRKDYQKWAENHGAERDDSGGYPGIRIENPCHLLGPDNKCTDYEHRPEMCRKFSQKNCDRVRCDRAMRRLKSFFGR